MYSTKLVCGHEFYFRMPAHAPDDLVWCYRCTEYRLPQNYGPPLQPAHAIYKEPKPSFSGLPERHYEPMKRSPGAAMRAGDKALSLKRCHEMTDEGYTRYEIARAIGVSQATIYAWQKQPLDKL